MLSLENVSSFEQLEKWEKNFKKTLNLQNEEIEYICEWKIDGLSVSLLYQNSQLTQISTRGNGFEGEDVTLNKNLIKNIPFSLNNSSSKAHNCEIRGEIFMSKEEFHLLNNELKEKKTTLLSNPRNAAAGTIMSLSPCQRNLNFIAYTIYGKDTTTQKKCLQELEKMKFETSPYVFCHNLEEVKKTIKQWEKQKENLRFVCDGIVIKVNNYQLYPKIGRTSRFPRWAIAFKFAPSVTYTRLLSIKTAVNKNGRISYIANLKPVHLLGSLIKKVTLHNYAFIKKNKINIGDEIIVQKSGEVVPQIVAAIKLEENKEVWAPPANCPCCFEPLFWDNKNSYQLCTNEECQEKKIKNLVFFASKNGMDITGLNEQTIKKLFANKILTEILDFFRLEQEKQRVLSVPGIKEKTFNNFIFSINKAKKNSLTNIITSLSIPTLGKEKAKIIAAHYLNLDQIINSLTNQQWETIKNFVGEKTTQEIKKFWENPKKQSLLLSLSKLLN